MRTEPRQPFCPYCEYNLTGIFDRVMTRSVRCPECGEDLDSHDVRWSKRPGDWTLATGIRNAARFLLWRGAIVLVLLLGSILVLELLGRAFNRASPGFQFRIATLGLVQLCFGFPAGKLLTKGFEDAAGFFGPLLPVMSTATLVVIAIVLRTGIPAVATLNHAPLDAALLLACGVAAIGIIMDYMREMM